jgi:hypothetical protein
MVEGRVSMDIVCDWMDRLPTPRGVGASILSDAKFLLKQKKLPLLVMWQILSYKYCLFTSYQPNSNSFQSICRTRLDIRVKSKNCFHFMTPHQSKNAYCIYKEGNQIKMRQHEIGKCPDSEYIEY